VCVGSLLAAGVGEMLHCEKSFMNNDESSDVVVQQDNAPAQITKTTKEMS